jgi:leucyl-tRNA---protein transferase
MFAQVHSPQSISAEDLDRYLTQGWFRMGQTIFTTSFLNFNRQLYSAIWLRVDLASFFSDKLQQKLFRLNEGFRAEFQPLSLTRQKEELYANYRQAISFEASASLRQLLFRDSVANIYNTLEANLYHGDKLIASGFFDLGNKSAAGIISFYDPAYKKYSLGKYLIYLKMHYCKKMGIRYFYPGYFVPGYYSFDYKLAIGRPALEYLDLESGRWGSIEEFSMASSPLERMHERLNSLKAVMDSSGIASQILKYEFFDVNLVPDLSGAELFDYPLLLYPVITDHVSDPVIVFDIRDAHYHLVKCRIVHNPGGYDSVEDGFLSNLLMVDREMYTTGSAEEMSRLAMNEFKFKPTLKF